jgi:hypothetical protein
MPELSFLERQQQNIQQRREKEELNTFKKAHPKEYERYEQQKKQGSSTKPQSGFTAPKIVSHHRNKQNQNDTKNNMIRNSKLPLGW